jgi:anti-anti-sigma factor
MPSRWRLWIEREQLGDAIVLSLRGRIATVGVPAVISALDQALATRPRRVVVDLAGVDYISSEGVRAFRNAGLRLAEFGSALVLCSATEPVRITVSLSGGNEFTLEASRNAALT